ncbi:hypothetical protein B7463_g2685, partial [Scytalidium lignicola]
MAQPLDLKIPPSSKTVHVRVINTTSRIRNIPANRFFVPEIKGFQYLDCPAYSFLIEHPSGRKLLFDLGVRKDWENLAPKVADGVKRWKVTVQKGVREILEENGVPGKNIEAVIWSHWHWDHTGDPSTFEKETALVVGPGFKDALTPGYPANKDAVILESDYEGRELREISFSDCDLTIGRFNAFDYFGDGSFYLLDSPGHAIGHLSGLARVSSSPDSFIFMAGDVAHHGGEFRPSQYLPLPSSISPNPFDLKSIHPCPGALFEHLLPDGNNEKPFFRVASDKGAVAYDADEAQRSVEKMIQADARNDILVVVAHDAHLLGVLDFFPKYADGFMEKGWVEKGKWLFLEDLKEAVN